MLGFVGIKVFHESMIILCIKNISSTQQKVRIDNTNHFLQLNMAAIWQNVLR